MQALRPMGGVRAWGCNGCQSMEKSPGMDAFRNAKRILMARLGNIKDVLMVSPAVGAVRRAWPSAELTLMVSPAGATVAGWVPGLDEVFVHRALWQDVQSDIAFDPAREQLLITELARRSFDVALIFTGVAQSPLPFAYACYLAGISVRAGQSREFGGKVLTHWVRPLADDAHQVDRNLHLVHEVGISVPRPENAVMRVLVPRAAHAQAQMLLQEQGISGDFVVIAPGATCGARRYPKDCYAAVAAGLRQAGRVVVVVGGPKDAACGAGIASASGAISLCGQTDIAVLAALLARARLLIGNDAAPMHMADAVGCPMVILYAGTDLEARWRPRHAPARILRRPTACSPCYRLACPYDLECLAISPAKVVAQALELMGGTLRVVAGG